MIVGVTGRTANNKIAGAGKSEVCKELQQLTDATCYAFADPIYAMLEAGFGIDRQQDKSRSISWLSSADKEITLRYLLETLGTKWGRYLVREDLWIMLANRFVEACQSQHIVIDGVRFENEADWIHSHNGLIVTVFRPDYTDTSGKDPASNTALDHKHSDWTIINDGGFFGLRHKVRQFVIDSL